MIEGCACPGAEVVSPLEEKSTDAKTFEQYREVLKQEGMRLACFIRVFRLLHERRANGLDELNIAPNFFQTVTDALFSAIVLWIDKLFAPDSQRGLYNFLKFVEHHRAIFSIEALKHRRGLPDDHWLLERAEPVEYGTVEADREAIADFESLKSFRLRRDKFHAHFDKHFFFDRSKIDEEAPLTWFDLDRAMELFKDILNRYSAAYDGEVFHIEPLNIDDLNYLLDRLHQTKS
jgi:hypothetical protein